MSVENNSNKLQPQPMCASKIITVPTPVLKFKGRVNNEIVNPTAAQWITQLETFFSTEQITSDELRISEAKRYIDNETGSAKDLVTLPHIVEITKWEDFRKAILELFRGSHEENPFLTMDDITKVRWEHNESLINFVARAEKAIEKMVTSIRVHFNEIPERSCYHILYWGEIYKKIHPSKRSIIMDKINTRESLAEQIIKHLKDQLHSIPHGVIKMIKKEIKEEENPLLTIKPCDPYDPNNWKWGTDEKQPKNKENRRCYHCNKIGHIARNCRKKQFFRGEH